MSELVINGYSIKPMANLRGASLLEANLRGASLLEANLHGANLLGAKYDVSSVIKARWATPSDETTLELMRLDCELLPTGQDKFDLWANGGPCPFGGRFYRGYFFEEKRELWKPGRPQPMIEIWAMLCKDHKIKWDGA